MSLSNHLSAYPDVHEALTAALEHGGGSFKLETRGKAFYWKARANHYKSLLHKEQVAEGIYPTTTPFDKLVVRIDKDDPTRIVLDIRTFTAVFETPSGEVVPTEEFKPSITAFNRPPSVNELDDVKFLGGETDQSLIDAATAVRSKIFGEES